MHKSITKVVALTLCLAMIACWIPRLAVPASAAAEYPNTHNNTGNMAADIVAVAVSQAGYCEGSLSGNPAYAGSNNYQKYGQWYDANVDNIGVEYAAWCAAFVSWCANQAGVPSSIVYYHAYCPYGVNWFRNQGRFEYAASRGGSYVPKAGDIVYFAPPGSSTSSHVGIVRGVSDGYVHTVEGNTSGQNGEVNEGGGVFLKSYSLSYSRLYGYGIPAYQDNSGKNPIGQIDSVTAEGPGKIRVRGWTMDEDALWTPLTTHIYIGGGPGDANAEGHIITADVYREDIAAAFPNAGGYHGFDVVLNTGKSGWQVVNVFGINEGGGSNTLLTNSGWIVDVPADTENPVISDVQVSNVSAFGYTVTCTVSDNVAIRNVSMPTWTQAWDQDDTIWGEATIIGNQATYSVSFSDHNFEHGAYNTHIYAYDLAGNYVCYPVIVDVPAVLTEQPVTGTVEDNTYFIASVMNKNYVVDISSASMDNNANAQLWFTVGTAKNQMWQISDPDGDGYYTIISLNSGKALDAAGGGTTDGTNVHQYDVNGTDAQLWKLEEIGDGVFRIVNKNSGLVLDLLSGILANGQNIQLYTANDSWAQMWQLIPADLSGPSISDVQFSEVSSEGFRVTCTVEDISAIQRVEFPTWTTNNGQDDQVWHAATVSGNTATCYISTADHKLESGAYEIHIYAYDTLGNYTGIITGGVTVPNRIGNTPVSGSLENGTYFIATSQNQNFVVDVEGISAENSANVYLWETTGVNTNQMWQISDPDGDGYYTVVALHSGKYLDVAGGIAASDTNVQQYEATNSDAQLWQIVPNDDGTYCLYSKCGGFALDLAFGEVINGTNIRIHDVNGTAAQKWYLIPAKLSADTAHTHTYVNAVVTEPTCTEAGYTTHTCANCGDSYVTDYVDPVGHSYNEYITSPTCTTDGVRTFTCACGDSYTERIAASGHSYVDGKCTICGADYVAPVKDYYLFGYINDANYACEEDFENMGAYKFVDGQLTVRFDTDSYVAVKTTGNTAWYMTDGWLGKEATTATLYNTESGINADKLFVPGGVEVTFTLTAGENDTLILSYEPVAVEPSVQPTIDLKYPTLVFEDVITMNVYFTASDLGDVEEMGLVTYTDSVTEASVDTADAVIPGYTYSEADGLYYASTGGIAAKNLGDEIYFAVYAKLSDGTYYYTKVVSYSPSKYAYSSLATGAAAMKPMVVAMLNYGAAAQTYFNYKTDSLINANLTAGQKKLVESYRSDMVTAIPAASAAKQGALVSNGGFVRRYPTVSFEGAFRINYYCTPSATTAEQVTMYYWDQQTFDAVDVLTTENATDAIAMVPENGEYHGAVAGIAAKDLDKGVYIAFVYSDGTTTYSSGVLAYSIGHYCSIQASGTGTTADLAKATAVYGHYANKLFNQ